MSTRAELEAALARSEIQWRSAHEDFDRANAKLAKANAGWDMVVTDRRSTVTDRRKAVTAWDRTFPDRRTADSDRRIPEADIAALAQAVADRHKAYLELRDAEAGREAAEARLNAAALERDKGTAALDELGPAGRRA